MKDDGKGREPDEIVPPTKQHRTRRGVRLAMDDPPEAKLPDEVDRSMRAAAASAAEMTGEYISKKQPKWYLDLETSKEGNPTDCIFNAEIIAGSDPAFVGSIRYNTFLRIVECISLPWEKSEKWRPWSDDDESAFCSWCQALHVPIRNTSAGQGVMLASKKNKVNPVVDYLESLKWDGVDRLSTWLIKYCNAKDSRYIRAIGRKWAIGLALRAYEPGAKIDHVLIAEGPQGCGKSTMAEIWALRREWFTADLGKIGTKDAMIGLQGKLVVEIAELAALRRSDAEGVKAFLTKTFDTYRPPYGRRPVDFPRCNGWFGSNNQTEWGTDETGNRRFWSVAVDEIDTAGLRRDIHQLWAQSIAAYKAGESVYLEGELIDEAKQEQADRMVVDPWQERIELFLERRSLDTVSVDVICSECLNMAVKDWDETTKKRIGRCLKALGYDRRKIRVSGRPQWRYVRHVPRSPELFEHGERDGERENANVIKLRTPCTPCTPSFLEEFVEGSANTEADMAIGMHNTTLLPPVESVSSTGNTGNGVHGSQPTENKEQSAYPVRTPCSDTGYGNDGFDGLFGEDGVK